jgi:hypothetical protein
MRKPRFGRSIPEDSSLTGRAYQGEKRLGTPFTHNGIDYWDDLTLGISFTPDASRHFLPVALRLIPQRVARVGGEGLEPPTSSV